MKSFARETGKVIKHYRLKKRYAQKEVGYLLGYKCGGQIISNIERGYCNLPPKVVLDIEQMLDIPNGELKNAVIKDAVCAIEQEIEERHAVINRTGKGTT